MINFFVDRPVLSGVLALVLVITGALSAFLMPISRFPDVAPPVVQVTATYTGGSAQAVEESVTRPLEQAINGVDGLIYLSSTSANSGVATISATFEVGYDVDIAAIDVLNRVNRAQASLPQAVRDLGVTIRKALAAAHRGGLALLAHGRVRRAVLVELRRDQPHQPDEPGAGHRAGAQLHRQVLRHPHLARSRPDGLFRARPVGRDRGRAAAQRAARAPARSARPPPPRASPSRSPCARPSAATRPRTSSRS